MCKGNSGRPLYSFISNMKVSDLLKRSRNLLDLAECHLNMSRLFLARSLKIGDAQAVYPGGELASLTDQWTNQVYLEWTSTEVGGWMGADG